jgi:protein-tyrosine-phosphatase
MAEGFARTYGSDILIPQSAGLAPAASIAPLTYKVMREKNIDLAPQFPKTLDGQMLGNCDVLVNMSGQKLMPSGSVRVVDWAVRDPIGESEDVYREVTNRIEYLVMRLILTLRMQTTPRAVDRPGFDTGRTTPRQ